MIKEEGVLRFIENLNRYWVKIKYHDDKSKMMTITLSKFLVPEEKLSQLEASLENISDNLNYLSKDISLSVFDKSKNDFVVISFNNVKTSEILEVK